MDKNIKERNLMVLRFRSTQAIIGDGYKLFFNNFRHIFRASWLIAIVYALSMGLVGWHFMSLTELSLTSAAIILLFLFAALLLASTVFDALREHKQTGVISRPRHWYGRFSVKSFLQMIKTVFKMIKHINLAFPHLGMLFVVVLMTAIVTMFFTLIGQLPAIVLTIANLQAHAGFAEGDSLGLPDNIGIINFATFTVTGFIQAYIHLSTLFPLYYAWGSIKAQKQAKDNETTPPVH